MPCALSQVGTVLDTVTTRDREMAAGLERAWHALQVPSGEEDRTARRIDELRCQAERNRKRLTDATLMLVDRTIDKAAYDRLYAMVQGELDAIDVELARLHAAQPERPVLPPLEVVLASADGWARMLHAIDTTARRDVLAELLEQVVPERVRIGRYRVRIAWTPLGRALRATVRRVASVAA